MRIALITNNTDNTKLTVSNVPEIIIMYLNHVTSFQSIQIPPNVRIIEMKGSIIKKFFNRVFIGSAIYGVAGQEKPERPFILAQILE